MADGVRVGSGRWARRLVLWPPLLLGVPLLVALAPVLFVAAAVIDLLTGPRRLRAVRTTGMALNYAVAEWFGLVAGGVLWVLTLGGLLMRREWSQRLHHRVQRRWTRAVMAALARWLRASWHVEGAEHLGPGPVIVCARHASIFDAVVPAVVLGDHPEIRARHVLKAELMWDPCLDLFGHRLPNHFVDRLPTERDRELAAVAALADDLGTDAVVIFPEGTFPTPARMGRAMRRVAEREPERARRLTLRHLLPVRPGGVNALIEAAPSADLVFIGHRGFEPFGSLRSIIANVPFGRPVDIMVWRVAAAEIPDDPDGRLALIDRWWQHMDDWIDDTEQREVAP